MSVQEDEIQKLFDEELVIKEKIDMEVEGSHMQLIHLYKRLLSIIRRKRDSIYSQDLPYVKQRLIYCLIRYGTNLKTQYKKNDNEAIHNLNCALRYDRKIPIAHYRLGFIYYKIQKYTNALHHFQFAIKYNKYSDNESYALTEKQLFNSQLYLSNSALHIVEDAQSSLNSMESNKSFDILPNYELSSLYKKVFQTERYLTSKAFAITGMEGKQYGSKEDCDEIALGDNISNTIILYFSDEANFLIFNNREIYLNQDFAEMLRYFLIYTSKKSPAEKHVFTEVFSSRGENDEIPNNTFTQRISRLRRKLEEIGVPSAVIHTLQDNNNGRRSTLAYYYNHSLPFIIMNRSDSNFILD